MFVGHFAVAMAAKRVAPRPPLGTRVRAGRLGWLFVGRAYRIDRHRDTAQDV